jgi:phage tail tape-measure protein
MWAARAGKIGLGLTGISLGLSAYQIVESENPRREATAQTFSWAGAYSLGLGGAELGASIGPWGSLAGGLIGSVTGGFVGEEGGKVFYDVVTSDLPSSVKIQILGLPFGIR